MVLVGREMWKPPQVLRIKRHVNNIALPFSCCHAINSPEPVISYFCSLWRHDSFNLQKSHLHVYHVHANFKRLLEKLHVSCKGIGKLNENAWALTALPHHALLVSILASWRHPVTPHGIMCHNKMDLCNLRQPHLQKSLKSRFSKWRP